MTDQDFARAFERGDVPPSAFGHRQHLRLAWVYLQESPDFDAALARIRDGIRQFAAAAGAAHKYHETITVAWMRLLDSARRARERACVFDVLIEEHPEFGDTKLPLQFYSRDLLFGDGAKAGWVEPDLKALTRYER